MAITIKKVSGRKELKKFIRFNFKMYKGNPYSVPDLYDDILNTFNKKPLSTIKPMRNGIKKMYVSAG